MSATSSRPPESHRGTAVVWAALLAVGLATGLWALSRVQLKPEQSTPENWLNGTAETALNQSLRLPGQDRMELASAAIRYRVFGDLGPQVALGCPQWMFYQDGLRESANAHGDVVTPRLRLMQYWHDQLKARNVALLVVAVPDKARIQSAQLCGRAMTDSLHTRYGQLAQTLAARGMAFADLRPVLENQPQEMFFRTDVHMNLTGAERAAKAVAQKALLQLGGVRGTQAFEVSPPSAPAPRLGDLLTLSGLKDAPAGWRPDLEVVPSQQIDVVRGGGLLDEAAPVQVLLAGSSNGLRSNFAQRLGEGLGQEVWNLSMDGGQFGGAMFKALAQREQWPASLKLVIWEFSENTLSLPLTDDEKKAIRQLPSDGQAANKNSN